MKTRILSTLLVLAMLLGMLYIAPMSASAADTDSGLTFPDKQYLYKSDKLFEEAPRTIEAWIKIGKNDTQRVGAIIGNWGLGDDPNFVLEIHNNGIPRLYWQVNSSKNQISDIRFSGAAETILKGEWVHLVIVRDLENKKVLCYTNGTLVGEALFSATGSGSKPNSYAETDIIGNSPFCIGGDLRSGNSVCFKGAIKGVATYNTALTAAQVNANFSASAPSEKNSLICYYDLSTVTTSDLYIKDLSGRGHDIAKLGGGDHTFTAGEIYEAAKPIAKTPNTFEAWVKLPSGYTGRPGIILGTYGTSSKPKINFELTSKAVPRLYWMGDDGGLADITFSEVKSTDICTGSWVHIAITRDVASGKAHCYINGELKQSRDLGSAGAVDIVPIDAFGLGADYRITGDIQNFKGNIKSAAIYSTCLTADQVLANCKASKPTGDATSSFICYYDLTKVPVGGNYAKDYSGNGYDLTKYSTNPYLTANDPTKEEVKDFDYTFVVVGDTQTLNYDDTQRTDRVENGVQFYEKFHLIYDWIINNKDKEKIEFVMGVGDITDHSTQAEWERG